MLDFTFPLFALLFAPHDELLARGGRRFGLDRRGVCGFGRFWDHRGQAWCRFNRSSGNRCRHSQGRSHRCMWSKMECSGDFREGLNVVTDWPPDTGQAPRVFRGQLSFSLQVVKHVSPRKRSKGRPDAAHLVHRSRCRNVARQNVRRAFLAPHHADMSRREGDGLGNRVDGVGGRPGGGGGERRNR